MSAETQEFRWPEGKRAALSLTFDDARASQLDKGLPILDAHRVNATFYVSVGSVERRLDAWKAALDDGHEIGNHSLSHICSGNFGFARSKALENTTLEEMEADILGGADAIERLLGVRPATFAYPCGQTFVGRGEGVRSYVPLVARHFLVGRSAFDETHNCPGFCDLAQVFGVDGDDQPLEVLKRFTDRAADDGGWLVFLGHDVGAGGRQVTHADALDALCRYAADPASGIWVDTVSAIGRYISEARGA